MSASGSAAESRFFFDFFFFFFFSEERPASDVARFFDGFVSAGGGGGGGPSDGEPGERLRQFQQFAEFEPETPTSVCVAEGFQRTFICTADPATVPGAGAAKKISEREKSGERVPLDEYVASDAMANATGRRLLSFAFKAGRRDVVSFLLSRGLDLDDERNSCFCSRTSRPRAGGGLTSTAIVCACSCSACSARKVAPRRVTASSRASFRPARRGPTTKQPSKPPLVWTGTRFATSCPSGSRYRSATTREKAPRKESVHKIIRLDQTGDSGRSPFRSTGARETISDDGAESNSTGPAAKAGWM